MADAIIIGAGAAGMMAAIVAAERGREVLLLEKMGQPGLKLRITGKGRCNLTNTAPLREFLGHVGSDSRFVRNSASRFFNRELMEFFESRGVPLVEERGGRVFPKSGKSLDIFLAMIGDLERRPNVEIRRNCVVRTLAIDQWPDGTRHVGGVRLADGTRLAATRVLVATGGLSYPTTGSTGAGYMMAAEAGHSVVSQVPSLVALTCSEPLPPEVVGFTLRNVELSVANPDGKIVARHFGEMAFATDGLAGPIVLSTSREVSRLLNEGQKLTARVDLKPAVPADELDRRLQADFDAQGKRLFNDALRLWLPAELVPLALKRLHIEYYKRLHQVNAAERRRLLAFLKGVEFTLVGTHGYNEAIVTQGGVSLAEVNPKTMESRLVAGLYFAGEVLDLDADTGGYNLQLAFTTAHAAGQNL
ncbi:MAG: NAD(P)/FAD-dependent oxidoreductase [Bacteroidales bacterium]|nr:NAD(P)/FAD-dependent oxidoreductase [Bacteroidales bacterium]